MPTPEKPPRRRRRDDGLLGLKLLATVWAAAAAWCGWLEWRGDAPAGAIPHVWAVVSGVFLMLSATMVLGIWRARRQQADEDVEQELGEIMDDLHTLIERHSPPHRSRGSTDK